MFVLLIRTGSYCAQKILMQNLDLDWFLKEKTKNLDFVSSVKTDMEHVKKKR